MKIYFSGPLSNRTEKEFNQKLTDKLEKKGFKVFLPQRDGAENNRLPYTKMAENERRKAIFTIDRDNILFSDIFLFILNGITPDEGACVELGIAYCQKYMRKKEIKLVGLNADNSKLKSLSAMVEVPLVYIATSEEELIKHITNEKNRISP